MKVRIVAIHKSDAWFSDRYELIGLSGKAHGFVMVGHEWYAFDFVPDHLRTPIHFACANFEKVNE